jgi:two-component system, response regulator RegA
MMASVGAMGLKGLLVDDDALYLKTLQRSLLRRGIETAAVQTCQQAIAAARLERPDFALIDLKLGTETGLTLIRPLKSIRHDMRILLVTGYASVATAVEAIKLGAENYLLKPVTAEAILRSLLVATPAPMPLEPTMTPLARLEWEHMQQALNETGGNISAAARLLGMHRRTLQRKLGKRPGPERRK